MSKEKQDIKKGLPKGWEWKKIGSIAETTSGGTPNRSTKYFWGGSIPWLKSGELTDGLIETAEEFITEEGLKKSSAKLFEKGTLLLALYGATAGKLGILNFNTTTNQAICAIKNSEGKFDTKYLYYFLLQQRPQIIKDSFGGAQPNISQGYIRDLAIPLPPLPEQKRIVARLEALFERTDKAIELCEQNLEHCGHLLPAALNEVIKQIKSKEVFLTDVCTFNPQKAEVKNLKEKEVSFLPMADLNEKQMFFEAKQTKKLNDVYTGYTYFGENDVLLAKVTPCFENGKSGIAKNIKNKIGFGSSEYYVFRAGKNILPEWLYYNISSTDFLNEGAKNMSGAVGLKRVTKDFINSWKIILPDIPTQQKIVTYLNQLSAKQQMLQQHYTKQLQHLQALKASLLDAAFRGEL